jgi:ABC-type Fe3+-hydroxamate transport system substrate-binding protein
VATITDDLGCEQSYRGVRRRIVSLVPSLTESVATVDRHALVGVTDWCTHPADLEVPRVRGTKNPDIAKIIALQPELVLANQEENRRIDVERLRAAGIPVWVTVIENVPQALQSLRRMFGVALGWDTPAWLDDADAEWRRPGPQRVLRAAVPIWRDPWMVVGPGTFTGDLLDRLGVSNVYADALDRYPHVDVDDIRARRPDVIVLPDEPYRFTAADGPEAFPGMRCALVEGRSLTWYGPSLVTAGAFLTSALGGEDGLVSAPHSREPG